MPASEDAVIRLLAPLAMESAGVSGVAASMVMLPPLPAPLVDAETLALALKETLGAVM